MIGWLWLRVSGEGTAAERAARRALVVCQAGAVGAMVARALVVPALREPLLHVAEALLVLSLVAGLVGVASVGSQPPTRSDVESSPREGGSSFPPAAGE
jgi:hypothetical protein